MLKMYQSRGIDYGVGNNRRVHRGAYEKSLIFGPSSIRQASTISWRNPAYLLDLGAAESTIWSAAIVQAFSPARSVRTHPHLGRESQVQMS
jgi:hypothetical protein